MLLNLQWKRYGFSQFLYKKALLFGIRESLNNLWQQIMNNGDLSINFWKFKSELIFFSSNIWKLQVFVYYESD